MFEGPFALASPLEICSCKMSSEASFFLPRWCVPVKADQCFLLSAWLFWVLCSLFPFWAESGSCHFAALGQSTLLAASAPSYRYRFTMQTMRFVYRDCFSSGESLFSETTNNYTLTSFPSPSPRQGESSLFLSRWREVCRHCFCCCYFSQIICLCLQSCSSPKDLDFWKPTVGWQLFSLLSSSLPKAQKRSVVLIGAVGKKANCLEK